LLQFQYTISTCSCCSSKLPPPSALAAVPKYHLYQLLMRFQNTINLLLLKFYSTLLYPSVFAAVRKYLPSMYRTVCKC
jgi:hypothetical protein